MFGALSGQQIFMRSLARLANNPLSSKKHRQNIFSVLDLLTTIDGYLKEATADLGADG